MLLDAPLGWWRLEGGRSCFFVWEGKVEDRWWREYRRGWRVEDIKLKVEGIWCRVEDKGWRESISG